MITGEKVMQIVNRSTLQSTYKPTADKEVRVETNSNAEIIENMSESFEKKKYSQKEFANTGEELEQEITLNNLSNFVITDVTIMDYMSEGARFKTGSVKINGEAFPNVNPLEGFTLPMPINPADPYVQITYTIIIDENPPYEQISNTASIRYSVEDIEFVEDTNTVTIQIVGKKIEIVKSANYPVAVSGSTITFTHKIKNYGSFTHTKLMFTDPLPMGITFVKGSVKVDGVQQPDFDPTVGFALNDLPANSTTTVTFDVRVV